MPAITARLTDLAADALLDTARVVDVDRTAPRFVRIALESDTFRGCRWTPGAKVQIRPRRGALQLRTYTPASWDADRGVTELIAFTHGEGPGSDWFRLVSAGDACEVFGPRRSVDLRQLADHVVFVGDESSVGLACALRAVGPRVSHVFESVACAEVTAALAELDLAGDCAVVDRTADRARLVGQARTAASASSGPFDLVVTGNAATVHAVRRDSRRWPRPPRRVVGKAYWALGRAGLD